MLDMGHPWIYDNEIRNITELNGITAGTLVGDPWGWDGMGWDGMVDDFVGVDDIYVLFWGRI